MALRKIFTVGHSTLTYESFLELVRSVNINAIADVRTSPYSRRYSHFDRETLKERLSKHGISYVYLGKELGGRPEHDALYRDGVADYERMALLPSFEKGIKRVIDGAGKYQIAMMCSEHDPLMCHRCLLVGRALSKRGQTVQHLLTSGRVLDQSEIEEQLLRFSGRQTKDMFASRDEEISSAYRDQARKVAFAQPTADTQDKDKTSQSSSKTAVSSEQRR